MKPILDCHKFSFSFRFYSSSDCDSKSGFGEHQHPPTATQLVIYLQEFIGCYCILMGDFLWIEIYTGENEHAREWASEDGKMEIYFS